MPGSGGEVVSALTDRLIAAAEQAKAPRHATPPPEVHFVDGLARGEITVAEMPADERAWREHLASQFPWLPLPEDQAIIVERVRQYGSVDSPMVSVHWRLSPRELSAGSIPEATAIRAAMKSVRRKARTPLGLPETAVILAPADPQIGKSGSRGGLAELMARVEEVLAAAEAYLQEVKPSLIVVADLGDLIEGFENHGGLSQQSTNDLSLQSQVEWARVFIWLWVELASRYASEVIYVSIPSNHCRWRKGASNLGNPSDDWGLSIARTIASECARHPSYSHIRVVLPQTHDEVMALDVAGTIVGFAHGHQASGPDKVPDWWAKQVHGGSPIADAEILLTGHFHSYRTQASGRHRVSGREKRWFQAPTLDAGSDWYRQTAGADSDPGLLALTVERGRGWTDAKFFRNSIEPMPFEEVA